MKLTKEIKKKFEVRYAAKVGSDRHHWTQLMDALEYVLRDLPEPCGDGEWTEADYDVATDAMLLFRKSGEDWSGKPTHAARACLDAVKHRIVHDNGWTTDQCVAIAELLDTLDIADEMLDSNVWTHMLAIYVDKESKKDKNLRHSMPHDIQTWPEEYKKEMKVAIADAYEAGKIDALHLSANERLAIAASATLWRDEVHEREPNASILEGILARFSKGESTSKTAPELSEEDRRCVEFLRHNVKHNLVTNLDKEILALLDRHFPPSLPKKRTPEELADVIMADLGVTGKDFDVALAELVALANANQKEKT